MIFNVNAISLKLALPSHSSLYLSLLKGSNATTFKTRSGDDKRPPEHVLKVVT